MEKMTIEFAGHKVSMRIYDYEWAAVRKAAARLGMRAN